ncbi:MAG: hypothetical protein E6Q33_08985 [Neisseriales bacterium]|nr:MAG: hypothetical protein E6Q33_08985 [Neisseriales bacterium]
MYLYNPVSGELKVSDKQIEGFEQITLLKYKSLKSKKTTDLQINGSALEVDGVNGVKGKNTKIIGKKTDDSLTVEIDADTGKIRGLVIEAENKAIVPTVSLEDNSNNAATTNWVNNQKYLKQDSLNGYATEQWVNEQGYLKQGSLNGYATEQWVNEQGYLKQGSLNGYATEQWVIEQGYLKQGSLSGYATEQWVNEQGYLKQNSLSDYATKNYVDTLTGGSYISRTTSGNFTGSGHGNITFTISLTVISQIINKDVISFVKIEFTPLQNTSGGNETITMGIVNLFNALKFTFTSNIDGSTPVHTTSSTCVPDLVRCTVNAIDKIFRISGNGGGNGWSIGGNVSNIFISNTIGRFTA